MRSYFACFGEVLAVGLSRKPLTDEPGGCAYISLLLSGDRSQILHTEHIVCAVRLNIKEWYSFDLAETNSVKLAEGDNKENVVLEPVLPRLQSEPINQQAPIDRQQQPDLPSTQQQNQKQQAVEEPANVCELSLQGLRSRITVDDLRTHFACFGEVLGVTKTPYGNGYVIIRQGIGCEGIRERKHRIRGVKITVLKNTPSKINSVR
ncbi:unnamed protein product [Dibothriocephalus latus]|uniref:Uncharacterized protein n=1 Tax=Dibothriocephalus latus TaxID=60516 RepID=A0A3P6R3I0_DIBLA|nr:unnamed protein product [Dibothriocephalus latus]